MRLFLHSLVFLIMLGGALVHGSAMSAPNNRLDKLPEGYQEDLRAHMAAQQQSGQATTEGVAPPVSLLWNQPVVTVAFKGGDEELYALIEGTAKEWTDHAGGKFRFEFKDAYGDYRIWSDNDPRNHVDVSDIRIALDGGGYWSSLGTVAQTAHYNEATMNFGGFAENLLVYYGPQNKQKWLDSDEHDAVLHEFGHALGFQHEHFHPDCQKEFQFDVERGYKHSHPTVAQEKFYTDIAPDEKGRSPGIYLYYEGEQYGWTHEQVAFAFDWEANKNEFNDLGPETDIFTRRVDRDSVMLYRLPVEMYKSGAKSKCYVSEPRAKTLSQGDIETFKKHYAITLPVSP